jgi:uncharacterized protein
MVDPELLEILACPNCKTKVELVKGGTALKCPQCRRVYPIKDDIPVMLIDEAVPADDAEHGRLVAKAEADGIKPTFAS